MLFVDFKCTKRYNTFILYTTYMGVGFLATTQSVSACAKLAYTYILDALQRGAFVPGQDISEATIASTLDISRTPVREAIIWLQSEGYLEVFPKKGTFVAKYSLHDILDVYNTRLFLEPSCIAASCEDLLPEELEKLQEFRAYNQKFVNDESFVIQSGEFFVQDINLHLYLFDITKNKFFARISTMAMTRCIIAKAGIYNRMKTQHCTIARSHVQLITAICDSDRDSTQKIMYNHLAQIRDSLIKYYTKV